MEKTLDGALDPKLVDALKASNYRLTLANQRKNSKLKLERSLTFSKNGGIFYINKELISFIYTLIVSGKESTILIDVNDNPIKIENVEDFFEEIYDRYYQVLNDYLLEHQEFKKARSVEKLVFGE